MDDEKKNLTPEEEEEDCKPLTDEEFKAFQENEKKQEKKLKNIVSAIWEAINFFT